MWFLILAIIVETGNASLKYTLKKKENLPLWRKLSYSIGYSRGLCWTGRALSKYIGYWTIDPIELISAHLYWLNSIELSAEYPLGNKKGIVVGVGYGWAKLKGYGG